MCPLLVIVELTPSTPPYSKVRNCIRAVKRRQMCEASSKNADLRGGDRHVESHVGGAWSGSRETRLLSGAIGAVREAPIPGRTADFGGPQRIRVARVFEKDAHAPNDRSTNAGDTLRPRCWPKAGGDWQLPPGQPRFFMTRNGRFHLPGSFAFHGHRVEL